MKPFDILAAPFGDRGNGESYPPHELAGKLVESIDFDTDVHISAADSTLTVRHENGHIQPEQSVVHPATKRYFRSILAALTNRGTKRDGSAPSPYGDDIQIQTDHGPVFARFINTTAKQEILLSRSEKILVCG